MTHDVIVSCEVPASPRQAWEAWTEAENLRRWLAPQSIIEARLGGAYELYWEPEQPERNSTIGCVITRLTPASELEISWKGPDQFAYLMNQEPLPTRVLVRFEPTGAATTRITLKHFGWGTGSEWEAARSWHERVWINALVALRQQFVARQIL